ncbi:MAG: S46 family peptidase [Polyangiales bacterium]
MPKIKLTAASSFGAYVGAGCLAVAALLSPRSASADEGMWLLNAFPSEKVGQTYGFKPDSAWLDNVRLSSVRLAQGCSASIVSSTGLVMTNHHCAHKCLEQLSSKGQDLVTQGFYAPNEAAEKRCPAFEINQLTQITDVTEQLRKATAGKTGAALSAAKKAEESKLEKTCATSDDLRCDVVELYQGGRHHLYQYRRYQDVRVVFAPELAAAFFGGDPDNFNFPRYDLDVSFLRIYKDGKPVQTQNYFPFSEHGAAENELTFVPGHPGHTSRELTVSQLLFVRRERLPRRLDSLAELRGRLTEFARRGPEQKRISEPLLFSVENGLKAFKGRQAALLGPTLINTKRSEEQVLRKRMASDKRPGFADAFAAIERATKIEGELLDPHDLLEQRRGFDGELFQIARHLVRAADELPKPNETRLREYGDAALPQLQQSLFSTAPIYPELETLRLTFSLTKLRERLGADDPRVKLVLGKKSPATLAAELVKGSGLATVATRKKLYDGGKTAIEASKDPLIVLARAIDAESRAVRTRFEDEVESPVSKAHEAIATVRFEQLGESHYPDATFTLRLSYGAVKGWVDRGKPVAPFTTLGGAFERHTGEDPFALPKRWINGKSKLALDTPFNFVSTNDIIGGNSGSPVINKQGQIVGLIFDGNIESLGGEYGFDPRVNRAVSVHSSALLETLTKLYDAKRIADELRSPKPATPAAAPQASASSPAPQPARTPAPRAASSPAPQAASSPASQAASSPASQAASSPAPLAAPTPNPAPGGAASSGGR